MHQRPHAYPVILTIAFILLMLDSTGVSPYAALRVLVLVAVASAVVSTACTLVLRDQDLAGLVATLILLSPLALSQLALVAVLVGTLVLIIAIAAADRGKPPRVRWAVLSRMLSITTAVLLLAIGIRSLQDGRLVQDAEELWTEGPLRPAQARTADVTPQTPDIYLFLLDGYPRSDKLLSEFGVDGSAFLDGLASAGFSVATHSRSNYLETHLTLVSMFNGRHVEDVLASPTDQVADRIAINRADALVPFERAGYQTIAVSSGFELVALRNVDRFIDTGQINDFERTLIENTVEPLVRAIDPGLFAREAGERTISSLDRVESLVAEDGPARFVFVHIASPHSPLVLTGDGRVTPETGNYNVFDDREQYLELGPDQYAAKLNTQVAHLDRRLLDITGEIAGSGRPSIVILFSDHGSGVRFTASDELDGHSDLELRSANVLAVRGIGAIDDRSTLVNLLPLVASRVLGTPFEPVPESINAVTGNPATITPFQRPD
jgi:Sulfatase